MSASFTAADLKNATLKIGVFHLPPKIIVQNLSSGKQKVTGLMTEILEIFANYLGYRYTYTIFPAGMFGREINGTWDGLIGSLINKEIDFESVCLIPAPFRLDVIDFSTSALFENYLGVIIHKPTEEQNVSFLTYFKPYPANIWFIIISLWLIICTCTTILDYGFVGKIWKSTLFKIFFLEELADVKYRLKTSKMITLWAFYVTLILLVSSYNSVLVASVAVKHPRKHFKNIDEVLKDGSYRFGINHNYHAYRHICEINDPPYNELGATLQADPDSHILDMNVGFKRALNEKFAYLVNSVDGKNGIQSMCSLEMIPAKYFSSGFYIGFPKQSPLREIISQFIHRLRTAGILSVILERGISATRPRCKEAADAIAPISLNHVILPFTVLGCGLMFSVSALILEKCKSTQTHTRI